jgi:orotidine-5'-phosphate decarboxylase
VGPPFGDLLAERVQARESQIVLGLDPDPAALWGPLDGTAAQLPLEHVRDRASALLGAAVWSHCRQLIDAAGPACVAVKPQFACFERLGEAGWRVLDAVASHAREQGLLVLADAKRGDIATTARAYAQALFDGAASGETRARGLEVDAVTLNPLMGSDTLEPWVSAARGGGRGVIVLVRTSNPGAAEIEDLQLHGGGHVWERLAELARRLGEDGVGKAGISDVGAVVGATEPAHLARARELMPRAFFLLPGVGAQGGRVEDLAAAFVPGRAGGLVAASRSIADAHVVAGGEPAQAARTEAERLRAAAWRLA